MAGSLVIRTGLTIVGSLPSGTGDPQLTVDAASKQVGQIPSVDPSAYLTTALPNGQIFVGSVANLAAAVAVTGAITITNAGVVTLNSGIVFNSNINALAAIDYSKLNLAGGIINNDINAAAAIVRTKIANGTAYRVLVNSATGVFTENAAITGSRALVSDVNGVPTHSAVTAATLAFLDITSSAQTQLNNRLAFSSAITPATGDLIFFSGGVWTRFPKGTSGQYLTSTAGTISWVTVPNGMPTGGSTGQYLNKIDGTDFNTQWSTLTLSSLTDVTASTAQVNVLATGFYDATSSVQTQLSLKLDKTLTQNYLFIGNISNVASPFATGPNGYILTSVGGVPTWVSPTGGGTVTSVAASGGTTGMSFTGSPISVSGTLTLTGILNVANGGTGSASGAWLLASGGTLAGANLIVGTTTNTITYRFNSLGVTQVDGAGEYLVNTAAATAGAQQISPSTTWGGQGWATTPVASQSVKFTAYVLPVQGATNPTAYWQLLPSINGAAYSAGILVTSNGSLIVGSQSPFGFIWDGRAGNIYAGGLLTLGTAPLAGPWSGYGCDIYSQGGSGIPLRILANSGNVQLMTFYDALANLSHNHLFLDYSGSATNVALATTTGSQIGSVQLSFRSSLWTGSAETKGHLTWRANASTTTNSDQNLTLYHNTVAAPTLKPIVSYSYTSAIETMSLHAPSESPYTLAIYNDTYSSGSPVGHFFARNSGDLSFGTSGATALNFYTNGYINARLSISAIGAVNITANANISARITNSGTGAAGLELYSNTSSFGGSLTSNYTTGIVSLMAGSSYQLSLGANGSAVMNISTAGLTTFTGAVRIGTYIEIAPGGANRINLFAGGGGVGLDIYNNGNANYLFQFNDLASGALYGNQSKYPFSIYQNGADATTTGTQRSSRDFNLVSSLWTGAAEIKGWFSWRADANASVNLSQALSLYYSTGTSPAFTTKALSITNDTNPLVLIGSNSRHGFREDPGVGIRIGAFTGGGGYDVKLVDNNDAVVMARFVATTGSYINTADLVVGGTTITNSSTLLDLQSTTKAMKVSAVTNIASVATPTNGMITYDAATNLFNFRQNGAWVTGIGGGGGGGGVTQSTVTTTSTLTTAASKVYTVFVDATGGNIVLTLPAGDATTVHVIKRTDSTANTVTFTGATIDGVNPYLGTTGLLPLNGFVLSYNGTNFYAN